VAKLPKKKCCTSKPSCKRCPLRMLADGTLPQGFTVKKRRLVKLKKTKQGKGNGSANGKGRMPEAA
jgi:hypothetical protein